LYFRQVWGDRRRGEKVSLVAQEERIIGDDNSYRNLRPYAQDSSTKQVQIKLRLIDRAAGLDRRFETSLIHPNARDLSKTLKDLANAILVLGRGTQNANFARAGRWTPSQASSHIHRQGDPKPSPPRNGASSAFGRGLSSNPGSA